MSYAGVVIGIMGADDQFDHSAFQRYAVARDLKPIVLSSSAIKKAIRIANQSYEYEIYAYSLGAKSVHAILDNVRHMPRRIVTIGAYKTVDVDFTQYNVEFYNYFDISGQGQISPGIHMQGVTHWSIQRVSVSVLLQK